MGLTDGCAGDADERGCIPENWALSAIVLWLLAIVLTEVVLLFCDLLAESAGQRGPTFSIVYNLFKRLKAPGLGYLEAPENDEEATSLPRKQVSGQEEEWRVAVLLRIGLQISNPDGSPDSYFQLVPQENNVARFNILSQDDFVEEYSEKVLPPGFFASLKKSLQGLVQIFPERFKKIGKTIYEGMALRLELILSYCDLFGDAVLACSLSYLCLKDICSMDQWYVAALLVIHWIIVFLSLLVTGKRLYSYGPHKLFSCKHKWWLTIATLPLSPAILVHSHRRVSRQIELNDQDFKAKYIQPNRDVGNLESVWEHLNNKLKDQLADLTEQRRSLISTRHSRGVLYSSSQMNDIQYEKVPEIICHLLIVYLTAAPFSYPAVISWIGSGQEYCLLSYFVVIWPKKLSSSYFLSQKDSVGLLGISMVHLRNLLEIGSRLATFLVVILPYMGVNGLDKPALQLRPLFLVFSLIGFHTVAAFVVRLSLTDEMSLPQLARELGLAIRSLVLPIPPPSLDPERYREPVQDVTANKYFKIDWTTRHERVHQIMQALYYLEDISIMFYCMSTSRQVWHQKCLISMIGVQFILTFWKIFLYADYNQQRSPWARLHLANEGERELKRHQ